MGEIFFYIIKERIGCRFATTNSFYCHFILSSASDSLEFGID